LACFEILESPLASRINLFKHKTNQIEYSCTAAAAQKDLWALLTLDIKVTLIGHGFRWPFEAL